MARRPTHKARAIGYIAGLLSEHRDEAGYRLPPLRSLARDAGVALNTVRAAVSHLVEAGTLAKTDGGHYGPSSAAGAAGELLSRLASPPTAANPKWQHVADAITRDILTGRHRGATVLPSVKELCAGYHASYQTVRKALDHLCETGVVVRRAKRYQVPGYTAAAGRNRLLLIARGHYSRITGPQLTMFNTATVEQLRTLERECATRNMQLQIMPVYYKGLRGNLLGGHALPRALATLEQDTSLLGTMVWLHSTHANLFEPIFNALIRSGRPFASLGDSDKYRELTVPIRTRTGQSFVFADDYRCGQAVGNLLVSRGHRRVAFVSIFEQSTWSSRRLEGLREALKTATGDPDAVRPFIQKAPSSVLSYGFEASERALSEMKLTGPPAFADGFRHVKDAIIMNANRVWSWAAREEERESVAPMLDRALASGATAWVAANDHVALFCLHHLRAVGKRVPRDVALVGFDDLSEATTLGLTSYNFNTPAIIHAMVEHIAQPDYKPRDLNRPTMVDGYVTVRGTAG